MKRLTRTPNTAFTARAALGLCLMATLQMGTVWQRPAIATLWASLRGQRAASFSGRQIPNYRLLAAFSSVMLYLGMFFCGSLGLLLIQSQPLASSTANPAPSPCG